MSNDINYAPTSIRLVIDMPYIYKDIEVPKNMTRLEAVNNYLNTHADEIMHDYLSEVEAHNWFLREIEFSDGSVEIADDDCFDPYAGEYNAEYFYYC